MAGTGMIKVGHRWGCISQGGCHGMGEQGLGWVSKLRTVPDGSDPATLPAWSGVTSVTLAVVIPDGLLRLGSRKGERKVFLHFFWFCFVPILVGLMVVGYLTLRCRCMG